MDEFGNKVANVKLHFVVDYEDDRGLQMAVVDAYGVYSTDTGDLLFYDQDGTPFDMWAAGHWLRCKVSQV